MAQQTITTKDILRQSLDRNRYFYGMLMTVRDFTMEQDHFTAKRLVSNRLLFGSGVICGLQVEKSGIDPTTTIEIKAGVAFDPLGREVTVLDVPGGNKFDLSKIIVAPSAPAPPPFTGDKQGFICLSHRECPKDPVPSLKSSPCDETCEASRWNETFDVSWEENTSLTPQPSLCEKWLNRTTAVVEDARFRIERTTPVWVRANDVFEVVVRVTAKEDATAISLNETRTGGSLIEPAPAASGTSQFPTPPVNLKAGEFFVYIYQLKSPAAIGTFELALDTAGLPATTSTVEVLGDTDAKVRESELTIEVNSGEPAETRVRIAELTVHFDASTPHNISDVKNLGGPRFRYSLERVTEMLDCLRAGLLTEAGSPRPGHALITFNDLETGDLKPIGQNAAHGTSFTVPHGDHVHALLLHKPSGLQFTGESNSELWIDGDAGGEAIRFLHTVAGQDPVQPQHLVTKRYVDAHISGLDWQESVLDKDLIAPPEESNEGDRYLLFNKATDAWKGQKSAKGQRNDIATFKGKLWDFTTPDEGTATFVEDENIAYMFVDGNWIPFLAVPNITAGDGLVAAGAVLSVGQGNGIVVGPNDVSVAFEDSEPPAIGPAASGGSHDTSARGDHAHELPLATNGGLAFAKGGLHIEGPINGKAIEFENVVSGQQPTLEKHLATKKYVDEKVLTPANVVAGKGLTKTGDTLSVAFSEVTPNPDGAKGFQGKEETAARGDHSHPLPRNTIRAATGVVTFIVPNTRERFRAMSPPIDPGLGSGAISVQLALFDTDHPEIYSFIVGSLSPPEPGVSNVIVAQVKVQDPTTFQIFIDFMPSAKDSSLPSKFPVRWFAYSSGTEAQPIEVRPIVSPVLSLTSLPFFTEVAPSPIPTKGVIDGSPIEPIKSSLPELSSKQK
jgi:Protein of unknown function (DUF2793)